MAKAAPSKTKLFFSFLRLGLTAFGGPAMVAYIRDLSIKRNQWVDEKTFKDGVALAQSIPGATAMQIAAYVGLRSRGLGGALLSYVGFGLPAFILMLILAVFYERSRNISHIISLFNGLQVIVVAIVADALYNFGKGTVKSYKELVLSAPFLVRSKPLYGDYRRGPDRHHSFPRCRTRNPVNLSP